MRLVAAAVGALALVATVLAFAYPQGADARRREQAYRANNAGVAALERFDYPAAATHFRQALSLDPTIALARVNLAIALYYAGDFDTARKEALAAAEQLSREPRAWFVAGLASRSAGDDPAAISALERVLQLDPSDAATLTILGQLYTEARRPGEAITRLTAATKAEPFNATATYTLGRALLQAGRAAEGQETMKRFQALRDEPYAVTYSTSYLQQGKLGEALLSTGTEPNLVDPTVPAVFFSDVTPAALGDAFPGGVESIALADVDGDRDFDLLVTGAFGVRLYRRDAGAWKSAPSPASSTPALGALAADYDNDGRTDVLATGARGVALWHQVAGGGFEDVTSRAFPTPAAGGRTAAFADIDHDGDLDFVSAPAAPLKSLEAWRNNGNGTFVRFDAATGLVASPEGAAAIVPTDFDNRRDIDLLIAGSGGLALMKNLRDGRFEDSAASAGLRRDAYQAVAAGDINADGRPDFFLGRAAAGVIVTSDAGSAFRAADAPDATTGARAAQLVDYDSDGVLDLVTLGSRGLRVLRNTGAGWTDVSKDARIPDLPCSDTCALAAADVDGDGDPDLLSVAAGRVRVWRNDGKGTTSLAVNLTARVSNRSVAGARIDVRAGSLLRRVETSIATPAAAPSGILFGLGARERADVVRIEWPSGIVQAEPIEPSTDRTRRVDITELDRKPSSCPYLYTWNGSRFEFVTDFLGGGEMGYWLAPGVRNVPDPEEYVRIREDQLVARDGRYELRVTNELEEALFIDRLSLIAVTHRDGTEVYPNEGLFAPPFPGHRLTVTRGALVPDEVVDEHGHDVRAQVVAVDRRAPADFSHERFRGYAADHFVEFAIPPRRTPRLVLLLTAWTDYAFSSDNVAASQAGLSLRPPSLEIREADGRWRTIAAEVGIPVGRPQTVVVNLTGRAPQHALRLRVRTNMRIYWDQIRFDVSAGDEPTARTPVLVDEANLRWRGFSFETSPDGREPFSYDYSRVLLTAPWKLMPGRYTREGDVRELVSATDDRFVVSLPGDEMAISFRSLPSLPAGWTRTFLLHADGFSKEMDRNSASPDVADPLPFHGMQSYPADALARRMTDAQRAYVERYNTRVITRSIPSLSAPAADAAKVER
jgi:tetratricopeptide (TPR) repeat protein